MSSVVDRHLSGEQIALDRANHFSAESVALLERACDDPTIGPERALAMILHLGLGLPQSLVARLLHTTKNVVNKQVISGKRRVRLREPERAAAQSSTNRQRALF